MTFKHWLHHLFNPHCPECQLKAQDDKVCESCETLKMQLSIVNVEKRQMLDTILSMAKPAEQPTVVHDHTEAVPPRITTWNVRRQMLEAEDRKKAQVLAEEAKKAEALKRSEAISKLEKELGVEENAEAVRGNA